MMRLRPALVALILGTSGLVPLPTHTAAEPNPSSSSSSAAGPWSNRVVRAFPASPRDDALQSRLNAAAATRGRNDVLHRPVIAPVVWPEAMKTPQWRAKPQARDLTGERVTINKPHPELATKTGGSTAPATPASDPIRRSKIVPADRAAPPPLPTSKPPLERAAATATSLSTPTRAQRPGAPRRNPIRSAALPTAGEIDNTGSARPVEGTVAAGTRIVVPSPADATQRSSLAQATTFEIASTAPSEPQEPYQFDGPSPEDLARTLVRLQDDMARGSVAALSAQQLVMRRFAEALPPLPAEVWSEPRQARGLVMYALSGGDPRVVRTVLRKATLPAPYDTLARGALAYLEGRQGDAERAFGELDDTALDASLLAALTLTRAALVVDSDPSAASELLARAAAAAPGTLVEEAALRRATLIAAEADDAPRFTRLTSRYLRKFRRSVYAGNFRQRLASALTRMSFIKSPGAFDELDVVFAPMPEESKRTLLLLIARAAVEFGNEDAARLASARALALSEPGTLDENRAQLYGAAADIVDAQSVESALESLEDLRRTNTLEATDTALLGAAINLGRTVTDLPEIAESEPMSERSPTPSVVAGSLDALEGLSAASNAPGSVRMPTQSDEPDGLPSFEAVEARVDAVLAAVDALLEDPQ